LYFEHQQRRKKSISYAFVLRDTFLIAASGGREKVEVWKMCCEWSGCGTDKTSSQAPDEGD